MNQSTTHILHAAAKGSKSNSTRLKKISIGEFSPFLFLWPVAFNFWVTTKSETPQQ